MCLPHEVKYEPGETFTCWRRPFVGPALGNENGLGEPCGAEVRMHGFHWCSQVCPVCLAVYWCGHSGDRRYSVVTADFNAWFPDKVSLRENIARHDGQYVPEFEVPA